jgi:DNA recombination protein RmuC
MDTLTLFLTLLVGLALGALLGVLWSRSRRTVTEGLVDQAEVMHGLDRLSDQMRDLDHRRASWQGQLNEQVHDMRATTETLRRETQALATALRKPQVRGRWGELHLRRAVELAGLVDRCDFAEQVRLDDGARRPDLVVHLVGGRRVVVDAKVPLDAYLDATSSDDDEERRHHLRRHVGQLRTHIDVLGSKQYWRSLEESPEFVVLFVPAESFLAAALDTDGSLIEYAAARQVVLATPTTLIALLRTVAHGWSHEALTDQAREIHRLGRELHGRLASMTGHLDQLGRSLNAAVGRYNQAVGSLESRVLVTARRFAELSVTDEPLPAPRQVESAGRSVAAAERPLRPAAPEPDADRHAERHAEPHAGPGAQPHPDLWVVDRRAADDEGDGDPTVAL